MLISQAMAQTAATTVATTAATMPEPPSAMEAFMLNMLLIVILVVMFYVLLIMPQQKRFKKHRAMLNQLKKGDEVITSGGFIGKIHKIKEGDDEIVVELAEGVRVTMLRSAIQNRASGLS